MPTIADYPSLVAEWHQGKNRVAPAEVRHRSARRFFWRCARDRTHVWQETARGRTVDDRGCPFCRGKRAGRGSSLADKRPDLAREWHPTKNGSVTPRTVLPGSGRQAFWRCPVGRDHVWLAGVSARVLGRGCPFCAGLRVSRTNSVAGVARLAREWHPTKNGKLTPRDVTRGSGRYVWWRCRRDPKHVWRTRVSARKTTGCPHCPRSRSALLPSVAAAAPHLCREWHPTRNLLTPNDVSLGSARRVWWKCPKGPDHEWQSPVATRARPGAGCPFCFGMRVSVTNSLARVAPEIAAQWHPTKNACQPDQVVAGSNQRFWWKCPRGPDHEWQERCEVRALRKTGCPFCGNRRLSVTNSLAVLPEIARQWHPSKNGRLTPAKVVQGSSVKRWWRCDAGHSYRASPHLRVNRKKGCPRCAVRRGAARMLETKLGEWSLADDAALAAQWDWERNGDLSPDRVTRHSSREVFWRCQKDPEHRWKAAPGNRSRGGGCPFCTNQRVTSTNSLAALFPDVAKSWHPTRNGKRTPCDVVATSHHRAFWRCEHGHIWGTAVRNRTRLGHGCPTCARLARRKDG